MRSRRRILDEASQATGTVMNSQIAIITHEYDEFPTKMFILKDVAERWRERGLKVEIIAGINTAIDAEIAIQHVDLTLVPPEYVEYARRFPVVLNGRTEDISKRAMSSNLVSLNDGYDGPVVVKSNYNYGGGPELRVALRTENYALISRPSFLYPDVQALQVPRYVVLPSASIVPPDVWDNPDLVVERFRPERSGELYCARMWFFLGNCDVQYISYATDPIVKGPCVTHREQIFEPVPAELRQIRKKLGFDFGKFDYARDGNELILYDVNRTPTIGAPLASLKEAIVTSLAGGIDAYI
jgi:hypothetical protein